MFDTNKHCNDVSSGAKVEFECDECERKFTTKQGRSLHKTVTHKKEKEKKGEMIKRIRSVEVRNNSTNFKCNNCNYSSKSKWALKAHKNHKHQEPTSPNEKKPKVSAEVVKNILSEMVHSITKEEEIEKMNKTTIEPTKDFLTNTAVTLAEMLDNIADQIDDKYEDEDGDTEELENRLDILRGDKPRNKMIVDDDLENTLVTLPLKDVEELRLKLRNLEDINENLTNKVNDFEELRIKLKNLEDANQELAYKVEEAQEKNKKREPKQTKEQTREEFIVIDMETNDETDGIEQLIRNKENGFSRSNPQYEPQKNKDINMIDCHGCDEKFSKREQMISHQKTHRVSCSLCNKIFKNNRNLQEHNRFDHDEMICHVQCGGGRCIMNEAGSPQIENTYSCNFCEKVFPSRNTLTTHRTDVHRTFKPCRDISNCQYQAGCFFSHVPTTLGKVRCYQCGEEYDTKNSMMIHRKIHGEVKECRRLINNQCDRGDNCWWSHSKGQQVFQKVQENLPPPIQTTQELIQQQIPLIQQQTQMFQNAQNTVLENMLKEMNLELMKIKEVLNIN